MSKCNAIDSRHTYVFDYPLTYLLWQFWFAISQFLVHNKKHFGAERKRSMAIFFKERSVVVVSLS